MSTPTWPSPTSPANSNAPPSGDGLEWLGRLLIEPRRFVLPVPSLVEGSTVEGPLEALPHLLIWGNPLLHLACAQTACPACTWGAGTGELVACGELVEPKDLGLLHFDEDAAP